MENSCCPSLPRNGTRGNGSALQPEGLGLDNKEEFPDRWWLALGEGLGEWGGRRQAACGISLPGEVLGEGLHAGRGMIEMTSGCPFRPLQKLFS